PPPANADPATPSPPNTEAQRYRKAPETRRVSPRRRERGSNFAATVAKALSKASRRGSAARVGRTRRMVVQTQWHPFCAFRVARTNPLHPPLHFEMQRHRRPGTPSARRTASLEIVHGRGSGYPPLKSREDTRFV